MAPARTIAEVLASLDQIIDWSKRTNNRIGYFASLYRIMTAATQQSVLNKGFQDGVRMELLDTIFANRYLQAWDCYTHKKACTHSWQKTFGACQGNNLAVIQHLILGINTHINLDLAIAAAEASKGKDIFELQADFEKIND